MDAAMDAAAQLGSTQMPVSFALPLSPAVLAVTRSYQALQRASQTRRGSRTDAAEFAEQDARAEFVAACRTAGIDPDVAPGELSRSGVLGYTVAP